MNRTTVLILCAAVVSGAAGFWVSQNLSTSSRAVTSANTGQLVTQQEVARQPVALANAKPAGSTATGSTATGVAATAANSAESGDAMPAFSLPDLAGVSKTPADYLGKPLVVNFWATWCGPCRKEMPELMALHRERGDEIEVLGIAMDLVEDVEMFTREMDIQYPIVVADDLTGSKLIGEFGNPQGMLPFTVFVDSKGVIRDRHLGPITLEQVEQKLATVH